MTMCPYSNKFHLLRFGIRVFLLQGFTALQPNQSWLIVLVIFPCTAFIMTLSICAHTSQYPYRNTHIPDMEVKLQNSFSLQRHFTANLEARDLKQGFGHLYYSPNVAPHNYHGTKCNTKTYLIRATKCNKISDKSVCVPATNLLTFWTGDFSIYVVLRKFEKV